MLVVAAETGSHVPVMVFSSSLDHAWPCCHASITVANYGDNTVYALDNARHAGIRFPLLGASIKYNVVVHSLALRSK